MYRSRERSHPSDDDNDRAQGTSRDTAGSDFFEHDDDHRRRILERRGSSPSLTTRQRR